jgi:uncharacterized low-complexity protein
MENKKNKTIVAGSMIAGALLSLSLNANTSSLFNYNALGTGTEVRNAIELACGEKKADEKKSGEATKKEEKGEKKAKDGKCGEGKCGEKKNPK